MKVLNFDNFINEDVKISVLDAVIDEEGNVYNGAFDGIPVMKGTIKLKKISGKNEIGDIIGDNGRSYPAGIDKNGDLVVKYGYGDIPIPDRVKEQYPKKLRFANYKPDIDYSFLLSLLPTGWVNVKIDMEVLKRVRRYSNSLGSGSSPHDALLNRLSYLDKTSRGENIRPKRKRESIQRELSVIMLLHYIKEIKDFFTPSASGFLFESFIAGLIPGSKVKEDNSLCDITSGSESYQIKLYAENTSSIPIAPDPAGELDHYIVCLKYPQKIDVYVLSSDVDDENYYGDFKNATGDYISKSALITFAKKYTLEIINIEDKIEQISRGMKSALDGLYQEMSKFQYNVEAIITGTDENGNLIDGFEFTQKSNDANRNIESMDQQLRILIGLINR